MRRRRPSSAALLLTVLALTALVFAVLTVTAEGNDRGLPPRPGDPGLPRPTVTIAPATPRV
ncbi:hypothetical protein OG618_11225 [Kitasatospora sp. NBC_01246]|uniref:hypothetical protein n=1 Tax=Kitasatospora sp. NBC_01246 TaxID=2903570 RepID=UPI002E30CC16|nr:hypothetical protein [Kitasatospora sp. NBC_01246]